MRAIRSAFAAPRAATIAVTIAVTVAVTVAVTPSRLSAQAPQSELRADMIGPRPYAIHGGLGLTWALGYYARLSAVGGYGVRPEAGRSVAEGRGDLIVRVTLDPFRQQRLGFSMGGGLTVRDRPYLLAIVDLEGPALGPVIPAVQLGVGGGVRAGLVLRRTMEGRR